MYLVKLLYHGNVVIIEFRYSFLSQIEHVAY